jgi:predicted RNase H-like HicB family nuclease
MFSRSAKPIRTANHLEIAPSEIGFDLPGSNMLTVEIIPDPEFGGFTARIPDIPAYGEGDTEDAAVADLQEAVRAYIEAYGVEAAMSRVTVPAAIRHVNWDLAELARG